MFWGEDFVLNRGAERPEYCVLRTFRSEELGQKMPPKRERVIRREAILGHTARSALAEPRESLNKSPSASGESFTPAFAYQNLEIHPVFLRF